MSNHPYTPAYEHGGLVYVSGAAGIDYATHQPVLGDREALDAALGEVERRLQDLGLGLDSLIKANYYVTDISLRDHANAQFEETFTDPRPARTFMEVSAIPYGARVAIEAIAAR